jgi:enolase
MTDWIDTASELALLSITGATAGYTDSVRLGMDVAASEFYKDGKYDLDFKSDDKRPDQVLEPLQLADLYKGFIENFPIISIEDPFDQDDWDTYTALTEAVGAGVQIVGDDLLVTNPTRIQTGIDRKACNALLLKVNQIGSVTESIRVCLC